MPKVPDPLPDYYLVLGVPPDATQAELQAAWRRQLRYWHPDRGRHPDALEYSKLINQAHDVLTDPVRRADYDRRRAVSGWRPLGATTARRANSWTRWEVVPREGHPRKSGPSFDHHGFVVRLERLMRMGRLIFEKRQDLASAAKWEAQTLTMLHDELGDHLYTQAFETALKHDKPEALTMAYGVLWAAYEDALKGDLKPAARKSGG